MQDDGHHHHLRGGERVGGTVGAVTDWLGRTVAAAQQHYPHPHHQHHGNPSIGGTTGPPARLVLTLTGWRRRCLFGLLLTLTVIVIINLSLTLWLLRSMQFSLVSFLNKRIKEDY